MISSAIRATWAAPSAGSCPVKARRRRSAPGAVTRRSSRRRPADAAQARRPARAGDRCHRLRQVLADSEPVQRVAAPGRVVGADRDDRHVARRRIRAQALEELAAGGIRQVQIEEDQVGALVAREPQAVLGPRRGHEPDARQPRERPLDQPDVHRVVLDLHHRAAGGHVVGAAGRGGRLLGLQRAHLRVDPAEQRACVVERRACRIGLRHVVVEQRQLEALRGRGETGEAERPGGASHAVRLECRGRRLRRTLRRCAGSFERVQAARDPLEPSRRVEEEDRQQLLRLLVVHDGQTIPSSWAAATASVRLATPSFS
jgi:hypothetical protein